MCWRGGSGCGGVGIDGSWGVLEAEWWGRAAFSKGATHSFLLDSALWILANLVSNRTLGTEPSIGQRGGVGSKLQDDQPIANRTSELSKRERSWYCYR